MAFGDEIKGELFDKLGVSKDTDPIKLISQAETNIQAGNHQKGKKLFEQAIRVAKEQATRFIGQQQHRAAAEALYLQAYAQEKMENTEERDKLYTQVIDELLAATKTALAFGEDNRGIVVSTLAGMVALMANDQNKALEIFNEYNELATQKENTEYLRKLLYSLGYLLDALQNDNVAALTNAQNYISTDLRPMLSTAKLAGFETLLNNVVKHTQEILEGRIKMPKIQISTSLPRDIQFNQNFVLDIKVENVGEGEAKSLNFVVDIPEDIEILDGNTSEKLDVLGFQSSFDRKFQLRFLTGDTSGEQTRNVKGYVTFVDMLGNSQKQSFGPIEIEFTAISKKEEYTHQLTSHTTAFEELNPEQLYGEIPSEILELIEIFSNKLQSRINASIEAEEFEQSSFGITTYENFLSWVKNLFNENPHSSKLNNAITSMVEDAKKQIQMQVTEKLTQEKEEALQKLRNDKDQELKSKIEETRSEMMMTHKKELDDLKEAHQKELQQIQTSFDGKLKQQLVQLETKLKEEFRKDIDKKNEETESVIREFQEKEREAIEDARNELREDMTQKYEARIKELQDSMEELKRQLTSRHEEELELELKTLRQKLEQDKIKALEDQERELREQIKDEFRLVIEEKDKEIQRLKSS